MDPDLKKAVDVLCRHYPSTDSDPAAKKTGKPLWSSEDYAASNSGSGGRCEARILNQNWVRGLISATINWNLISAYYDYVAWPDDGFSMTARWPWSGHYEVQPPLWAAAHTSQFVTQAMCCCRIFPGASERRGLLATSIPTWHVTFRSSQLLWKVQPGLSSCGFPRHRSTPCRTRHLSCTCMAVVVQLSASTCGARTSQRPLFRGTRFHER